MMLSEPPKKGCEAAHRISWMLFRGEIPVDAHVLHKCDVTLCVNPDHLFLGTHTDNMQDCVTKGRKVMPSGPNHWRHKGKR
jgi:HNH endonuclease